MKYCAAYLHYRYLHAAKRLCKKAALFKKGIKSKSTKISKLPICLVYQIQHTPRKSFEWKQAWNRGALNTHKDRLLFI